MPDAQDLLKRSSKEAVVYVGWIHSTFRSKKGLEDMGVCGKITLRRVGIPPCFSAFEYCEATEEVMQKLIKAGLRYPGAFTGLDEGGNQTMAQKYWHWGEEEAK